MTSNDEFKGSDGKKYQILSYIDPNSTVAKGSIVARFREPGDGGDIEIGSVISFDGFGFYFSLVLLINGREVKFDRTDGAFAVVRLLNG